MLRLRTVIFLIWYCIIASTSCVAASINPCNDLNCGNHICPNSTDPFSIITPRLQGTGRSRCSCPCPQPTSQPSSQQYQNGCGFLDRKNITTTTRIIGINEATLNYEAPWVVAILTVEKLFGQEMDFYYRAGSLINPMVVLTAAHPFSEINPDTLLVRAGESNMHSTVASEARQDGRVSRLVIHKNYTRNGFLNDIALLFLRDRFEITQSVNTICLPPPNQNYDLQSCLLSGWGKDGVAGNHQDSLKTIELPIVPRDACVVKLREEMEKKFGPVFDFNLHDSIICAGGEAGKDGCDGDGGAPLYCPIPGTIDQYHQVGIVSWGIGCGDPIPGGYVNVPYFRKWIDEELNR